MSTPKTSYTAVATATGGRNGHVKSDDGVLDLNISIPKEFGGEEEGHTNPEQLFAAGWAACFDNAVIMIAKSRDMDITSSTTVEVTLGQQEGGSTGLSAVIKVKIENATEKEADKLITLAHKACPYSKATKGNIKVETIRL